MENKLLPVFWDGPAVLVRFLCEYDEGVLGGLVGPIAEAEDKLGEVNGLRLLLKFVEFNTLDKG